MTHKRKSRLLTAASVITILRIAFSMLLIFPEAFSTPFYVLYAACGFSDMLDGFVARRTHTETELGAKLDSAADVIFLIAAFIRVIPILKIKKVIRIWVAVIAVLKVVPIINRLIGKREFLIPHTIANKVTGGALFLSVFFMKIVNIDLLAALLCVIATFAAAEPYIGAIKNRYGKENKG